MGESFANLILAMADSFKGTAVPGYVVIVQLSVLLLCLIAVNVQASRRLAYPKSLVFMLRGIAAPLTRAKLAEVNPFLLRKTTNVLESRQKRTWSGFCDSLDELDGMGGGLSALVAPRDVLTRETLYLGHGIWRHVPGLFVSTGLVLTFLGLIAALRESGHTILLAGEDPELLKDSLSDLLRIASAKFIMSLTGLVSSIVLGFYLNVLDARTNRLLAQLAGVIENRVSFASPERTLANILMELRGDTGEVPLVTFRPDSAEDKA